MIGELDIVETQVDVVTFFDQKTIPAGSQGIVVSVWNQGDAVIVEFAVDKPRGHDIVTIETKDLVILSRCPLPGEA